MFIILWFFISLLLIIIFFSFGNLTTLADIFFFGELIWLIYALMNCWCGALYDDVTHYNAVILILFLTAVETGMLTIFTKMFTT